MTPIRRRTWALSAFALTLILGACSTPNDLAAPPLEPQFGTSGNDAGDDVTLTSSGSVVAVTSGSHYEYQDADSGPSSENASIYWDRYDKSGNFVKRTVMDTKSCEMWEEENYCFVSYTPKTVVADTKGFTYILGVATSVWDDGIFGYHYESFGQYVFKIDAAGQVVKQTTIGSVEEEWLSGDPALIDLAADASGNFYVAGALIDSNGGQVNAVAKYSTAGTLLWQRTSPVGTPYGISVSSNGYVYVGGLKGVAKYTNSGNLSWTKTGDTRDVTTVGTNTVYARYLTTVRKLDATGKQLWSKAQSGLSGLVIADMAADANGNVYLTGKYNASSGNRDVFTRKLKSSGTTVFTKTFGTSAYDDARGIATINGSEIYLTGSTQGSLAHPFIGGENDGYVRKLNSSGNPVWTR